MAIENNCIIPVCAPSKYEIDALLDKASEIIEEKQESIEDMRAHLYKIDKNVDLINQAIGNMKNASDQYLQGHIDGSERREVISNSLKEIRIPVKELQLQMGKEVDTNSVPNEGELRDFQMYVQGFAKILRDRIKALSGVSAEPKVDPEDPELIERKEAEISDEEFGSEMESLLSFMEDDSAMESSLGFEIDDSIDDSEKYAAIEFRSTCESLMIHTHEDSLEGALEALVLDLTNF